MQFGLTWGRTAGRTVPRRQLGRNRLDPYMEQMAQPCLRAPLNNHAKTPGKKIRQIHFLAPRVVFLTFYTFSRRDWVEDKEIGFNTLPIRAFFPEFRVDLYGDPYTTKF